MASNLLLFPALSLCRFRGCYWWLLCTGLNILLLPVDAQRGNQSHSRPPIPINAHHDLDNYVRFLPTLQKSYAYQHMPNVLRRPLKRAKPDGHAKEALATPSVAWNEGDGSRGTAFRAVDLHVYRLIDILL